MLLGATPKFGMPGGIRLELFRICATAGPVAADAPNVVNCSVITPPLLATTRTFATFPLPVFATKASPTTSTLAAIGVDLPAWARVTQ